MAKAKVVSPEIAIHCKYDALVDPKDLKHHPRNRNKHSKEQIERLAKILEYQGWRYAIKVSKRSDHVTSGHGRIMAALLKNWRAIPVVYQDYVDDAQEYADVQADNAIASWAELELGAINADVIELGPDFDIDMLGIKDFVLEPADKYADQDADDTPEVRKTDIKLGDLFQLGNHRLLCGDATKKEDVERLMGGEKADMVFTDPPYGVSYSDKNAFLNTIDLANRSEKSIQGDHESVEDMKKLWDGFLASAATACHNKASYYICSPQGGKLIMMAIDESEWDLKHTIIWVKNNHVLGRCDYNYKHEPILYGWKKKGTHEFIGNGRCKTSVWDFNKPLKNDLHPTMKPVELIEEAIKNSSAGGAIIFDCFLGSGSTLIACEKTNRKCFGSEIDPQYVQVIIDRWEKFTGQKAVKL